MSTGGPSNPLGGVPVPLPVLIVGDKAGGTAAGGGKRVKPAEFNSVFDRMPRAMERLFGRGGQAGRWSESMTNKLGSAIGKGGAGTARAAGAVGAAVGATVAALDKVKGVFVDPFIHAIEGGFATGVARGGGADVLGKSAMALGTIFGLELLPVIIEVSTALLELAEDFRKTNKEIRDARANGEQMGDTFDNAGKKINRGEGDTRNWLEQFDDWTDRFAERNNIWHSEEEKAAKVKPGATGPVKPGAPVPKEETPEQKAKREKKDRIRGMIVQSFELGLGAQAGYHGVADVREAAQLAAMEDPIDKMIRDMTVEFLNDWKASTGPAIKNVASNTDPKNAPK